MTPAPAGAGKSTKSAVVHDSRDLVGYMQKHLMIGKSCLHLP